MKATKRLNKPVHWQVYLYHFSTHNTHLHNTLIYVLDTYRYIKAYTNNVKLTNYDHTEVDIFYTLNINTLFYLLCTHSRHHTDKTNTLLCSHVDHTTAPTRKIPNLIYSCNYNSSNICNNNKYNSYNKLVAGSRIVRNIEM